VGDRLYGKAADRLMLHAAKLAFGDYEFTDLIGLGNYNLPSL
jgi:23S rRNA-/tRNA-specific pseudouridylate synthase